MKSSDITATIQALVRAVGPNLGFLPSDVSARSLRAAGAMALLCAHVDSDTIRLFGRWRSDVMLRYLTVQAQPVMRDFARRMLAGGDYLLLPNQDVPAKSNPALNSSSSFPTHPALSLATYYLSTKYMEALVADQLADVVIE